MDIWDIRTYKNTHTPTNDVRFYWICHNFLIGLDYTRSIHVQSYAIVVLYAIVDLLCFGPKRVVDYAAELRTNYT